MTVPERTFVPGRRTRASKPRTKSRRVVDALPICFYCRMPAARCEYDHFPLPQRHGGTETVPACINCHELKDRVASDKWPQDQGEQAFVELKRVTDAAGTGVLPAVMFIQMWGEWDDHPNGLPLHWADLSPLARILWARWLCLHLDGKAAGVDTSPAALTAAALRMTAEDLQPEKPQLGKPMQVPDEVLRRVILDRAAGVSLGKIAAGLMADGITTGSGSPTWHPVQVQRALDCQRGREISAEMFGSTNVDQEETAR